MVRFWGETAWQVDRHSAVCTHGDDRYVFLADDSSYGSKLYPVASSSPVPSIKVVSRWSCGGLGSQHRNFKETQTFNHYTCQAKQESIYEGFLFSYIEEARSQPAMDTGHKSKEPFRARVQGSKRLWTSSGQREPGQGGWLPCLQGCTLPDVQHRYLAVQRCNSNKTDGSIAALPKALLGWPGNLKAE